MAQENWQVDGAHSAIHFSVRHMVISKVRGHFGKWSAKLALDTTDLTRSSVEVEIDAASIDTGVGDRDAHLRSADFFDAEKNPAITFKSKVIKSTGKDTYDVTGDLTIRGVTKVITLPVTFLGEAKDPWGNVKAGFSTATTLNRQDFGVSWNAKLDQGGFLLADEVKVEINLEVAKK